jgi:RNA polymerase-binding protein DksA
MATPKKKTNASSKAESAPAKSRPAPAKGATKAAERAERGEKGSDKAADKTVEEPRPALRCQIDPDLLEEIRLDLVKKKQELGANVNSELDDMREAAEGHHLADMDDLGGDAHDEETQYKIMEIESAELGQIDLALERITAGTFGICEVCEKPITPERLRALPFANLCINCKRQQELNDS